MLHLAFLTSSFLAMLGCSSPQSAAEVPVIKGELKDVPAQGNARPMILCEGTANLPDDTFLNVYIYYERVNEGREVAKDVATVKGGKFSQEFVAFHKKNLAGKYIARLLYNPDFQNKAIPGFKMTRIDTSVQFGTTEEGERETKAIRDRLVGEIQSFVALGDEVKAKITELKGKPAGDWEPLIKAWRDKSTEIQRRAQPRNFPEYRVLNLDLLADSGLENLAGILISAAKYASVGKGGDAMEGLTRLRQTAEYTVDEIAAPKLTEAGQILQLIDSARKLLKDALGRPDDPVLPVRRKFVEMNALLQKSVPEDCQAAVLEIGTRSTAFFSALSDKQADAKELHAELDKTLEKLSASLRGRKGS